MPLWIFSVLLLACAAASLIAGIWLILHFPAVAKLFRRERDMVPGRRPPTASRGAMLTALVIFNAGWIASILIWVFAMSGAANEVGTPF